MAAGNEELEEMKCGIDLVVYAASKGFEIDRRRSCRTSVSMKNAGGDRIIVGKDTGGRFLFSSCHGGGQGSILDFVMWQLGGVSLGFARKELRPWLSGEGASCYKGDRSTREGLAQVSKRLVPPTLDLDAVRCAYADTQSVTGRNLYLTERRGIPVEIYTHPIFKGRVRTDKRGNLIFPHWSAAGEVSGFEIKQEGYTGFAKGGRKMLFASRPFQDDTRLVICETAIDLLSYAAIHGLEKTRFVSTAGTLNPYQPALLRSAMTKLPEGGRVIAAVDADNGGDAMVEELKSIFDALGRSTVQFVRHSPKARGRDWNDGLRKEKL